MTQFFKNNRKLILVVAMFCIAGMFFVVSTRPVHASWYEGVASAVLKQVVLAISVFLNTLIGKLIGVLAYLISALLDPQLLKIPDAVRTSWVIMRNFVNLFFVLSLIVMAAGTIFEYEQYSFKNLFPKFLIAALLINFSFVMGEYVYNISNGISVIFLNQMKNASGFDFSENLGRITQAAGVQMADLQGGKVTANPALESLTDMSGATSAFAVLQVAMQLLFFVGIFLAFLVIVLFLFIRMIVIWFLLLISPLAWLGLMFPNLKAKTWSRWWTALFNWCFSLPSYIFFVAFAVMFFAGHAEVASKLATDPSRTTFGFAVQDILFYLVTLFFLFFGLFSSFSIASFGGSGVSQAFTWTQNRIKNRGGQYSYASLTAAGKGTWDTFLKEGMPGEGSVGKFGRKWLYGGDKAQKQAAANTTQGVKRFLGYHSNERDATYNTHAEELARQLEEDYTNKHITAEQIMAGVRTFTDPKDFRYYAYRKAAASIGKIPLKGERDATTGKVTIEGIDTIVEALGSNTKAVNEMAGAARAVGLQNSEVNRVYSGLEKDILLGRKKAEDVRKGIDTFTDPNTYDYFAYRKMGASMGILKKTDTVDEFQDVINALPHNQTLKDEISKVQREATVYMARSNDVYGVEKKKYDRGELSKDQIRDLARKYDDPDDPQYLVYRKLAARVGILDNTMLKETLVKLKPKAAIEDFLASATEGEFRAILWPQMIDVLTARGEFASLKGKIPPVAQRTALLQFMAKNRIVLGGKQVQYNPATGARKTRLENGKLKTITDPNKFGINEDNFKDVVEMLGGIQSVEMQQFDTEVKLKRPDLHVLYEQMKVSDRGETPKSKEDLIREARLDIQDFGILPMLLWNDRTIRKLLREQIMSGSSEAARRITASRLQQAINKSGDTAKQNAMKQRIIEKIKANNYNPDEDSDDNDITDDVERAEIADDMS